MAQEETLEVEAEVMEDKEMLQEKSHEEQMEQVAQKILQEEVIKTTTQIGVMQNSNTIINMEIMQVNIGRRKMISQDKKMWLM